MNTYTNEFLLNSLDLPVIKGLYDLSDQMAVSTKLIYNITNHQDNYYKTFEIKKDSGKTRKICSPKRSLKLIQKWVLVEILEKIKVSDEAMAYTKDRGIKENAERHRHNNFFLEMDLKDFFETIKRDQVFYFFRNIGYNILVSNILSRICTFKGSIPQGGVCSPYLSNIICYNLDKRLSGLSSKRDITYTRYSDDLTFSCNNEKNIFTIKPIVNIIIKSEGFVVNPRKTRFLFPTSYKKVTGLCIIDKHVKVKKSYKRNIRASIHRAILTCDYSKAETIKGKIEFVNYIEEGYKRKVIKYIEKLTQKKEYNLYKDIVNSYNENKFFLELKNMEHKSIDKTDLNDSDDLYQEINYLANKRFEFLKSHGYDHEDKEFYFNQIKD